MTILTGANITVILCNVEVCRARFEFRSSPPDHDEARQAAIRRGWVSVRSRKHEEINFCPRHAYGSKRAGSSQVRVFQPPPPSEGT